MPAPVDASGAPVFTNEALSKQIQASFQEGKREAFWVALVNSVVDAVLEFMRPSAMQQALMTSLLTKGATTTTTVINQGATPVPIGTISSPPMTTLVQRTAGQVPVSYTHLSWRVLHALECLAYSRERVRAGYIDLSCLLGLVP